MDDLRISPSGKRRSHYNRLLPMEAFRTAVLEEEKRRPEHEELLL